MTGNYEEDEEEEDWEKGKQQIEAAGRGRRFTKGETKFTRARQSEIWKFRGEITPRGVKFR